MSNLNREIISEFAEIFYHQRDVRRAFELHVSEQLYIQHNPTAPDGIEGFKAFIGFLKEKFPDSRSEIKRAFADGDYVILHIHSVRTPGSRGRAIVDIFRMEHGKIVEHWDVIQDVPIDPINSNPMF